MRILTAAELKMKLDRGDTFKLVMALDRYAFAKKHIPGSLHFDTYEDMAAALSPDEEVVVYCSNPKCPASMQAYYYLESKGFRRLYRFAGGLAAWEQAGYALAGSMAPAPV
ncbi:MAG: rhodanese-like domain-containing protein [Anaerolineales bacterium]|nr:rhodanese-like domain-containing protein [Anaerolineales bacterium]